ncbi:MAG: proteasome-activating nucleotidase, partial [Thermoplasmata archaeon]
MDEDDAQEFYERLSERIALLEQKNDRLLQDSKLIEGEKRFIQSELGKLRREAKRLKAELDRLKSPPLIIGMIRDILVDGRVVVKSSTGPDFIVQAADYVDPDSLVVGSRVALNKQTLAVMGVLPPSYDPIVMGAEVIEKPPFTYTEIGGLKEALREVREAVEE